MLIYKDKNILRVLARGLQNTTHTDVRNLNSDTGDDQNMGQGMRMWGKIWDRMRPDMHRYRPNAVYGSRGSKLVWTRAGQAASRNGHWAISAHPHKCRSGAPLLTEVVL